MSGGKGTFRGKCFNCGEAGHRRTECTKTGANAVYEEGQEEEALAYHVESVWNIGLVEVVDAWQTQPSRRTRWKARSLIGCESSCCRGAKGRGGMTDIENFFEALGSDDDDDFEVLQLRTPPRRLAERLARRSRHW